MNIDICGNLWNVWGFRVSHMGTGGALCSPVGESKLSLVLFIQGLGVNLNLAPPSFDSETDIQQV